MTAQSPEVLTYKGVNYLFDSYPFDDILKNGVVTLPSSEMISTGLYRGYIGTWNICSNKLYLIALSQPDPEQMKYGFEPVFGLSLDRVLADWYTGEILAIPANTYSPYGLIDHSQSMNLFFEKGCLIKTSSYEDVE